MSESIYWMFNQSGRLLRVHHNLVLPDDLVRQVDYVIVEHPGHGSISGMLNDRIVEFDPPWKGFVGAPEKGVDLDERDRCQTIYYMLDQSVDETWRIGKTINLGARIEDYETSGEFRWETIRLIQLSHLPEGTSRKRCLEFEAAEIRRFADHGHVRWNQQHNPYSRRLSRAG